MERHWTIFTNHAAVFLYLLEHPDATIRRIADDLALAERTVVGVLHDLRADGYLLVQKEGRHNVYRVNPQGHMRRPEHAGQTLEEFLARVLHELERARRAVRNRGAQVLAVDPMHPDPAAISQAAEAIRQGHVVAFPTETVYGLGADALNALAVEQIFRAKGRPADNPLIVHIGGVDDLDLLTAEVPLVARTLAARFWPGPLTLVLPRSPRVPDATTGGLDTVALRVPAHPVALALLRAAGRPIAAPSANRSGRPSPTSATHVLEDLRDQVALVLDGGPCPVGVESTVLDITVDPPALLRPGGVPREDIEAVVGEVRSAKEQTDETRRSPGTRYRHYAPRATVLLAPPAEAETLAVRLLEEGKTIGIMARLPVQTQHPKLRVRAMSEDLVQYARELYSALRDLDAQGCHVIVAESVEERGVGTAIMDRLRRAASGSEEGGDSQSPRSPASGT